MKVHNTSFLDVRPSEFDQMCTVIRAGLRQSGLYDRGSWQSQQSTVSTRELWNVHIEYGMPQTIRSLHDNVSPNLPWADDHFAERVGGEPLNPPPSAAWWPYNRKNNAEHKSDDKFSHTYPERFWPKRANENEHVDPDGLLLGPHRGIRFAYGDLADVVEQLQTQPFTRQAYLPVWFPEDTGGAGGERVPCSLGYHFIRNGPRIDCNYFMRSCDFFRHFRDDVYLAIRLTEWVQHHLPMDSTLNTPWLGKLNMFITNLHCFAADDYRLQP